MSSWLQKQRKQALIDLSNEAGLKQYAPPTASRTVLRPQTAY